MKKALFFDIDGTLLPEGEFEIRPQVVEAIKKAEENGAMVFICTGRCYHQAKKYIDQLGSKSYICSNGQEICIDGEIIYQKTFPTDLLNDTIDYINSMKCPWGYETGTNIFVSEGKYAEKLQDVLVGYGFQDISISNEHLDKGVYQVWIFGNPDKINETEAGLNPDLSYYKWNEYSVEIQPGNENKGIGVSKVNQHFHNSLVTYGFGDGANDLEFLAMADHGIAMGNADDDIKEVAEYITSSCVEDGIIKALKHYNLI